MYSTNNADSGTYNIRVQGTFTNTKSAFIDLQAIITKYDECLDLSIGTITVPSIDTP